jgi:hypothetical protein
MNLKRIESGTLIGRVKPSVKGDKMALVSVNGAGELSVVITARSRDELIDAAAGATDPGGRLCVIACSGADGECLHVTGACGCPDANDRVSY